MGLFDNIAKSSTPIGLGLGALGTLGKLFSRLKSNSDMRSLLGKDPTYEINPLAKERLALAQTMLNARMPGAIQVERNIQGNQANRLKNIERNASDASQFLALGGQTQTDTNDAYVDLGLKESQDYQRRYGNLVGAQEGLIAEGDKVYQDKVRRFGDEVSLRGGVAANRANNWGDISNFGFSLADFGMAGGFNNYIKNRYKPNGNNTGISVGRNFNPDNVINF